MDHQELFAQEASRRAGWDHPLPSHAPGSDKRFLALWGLMTAALLVLSVTVNGIIAVLTPAGTGGWHNFQGFFSDVQRRQPEIVVVGSSRSDAYRANAMGSPLVEPVNPAVIDWGGAGKQYSVLTLYNASFPETVAGFLDSGAAGSARAALIGLDFFGSNAFFKASGYYPIDLASRLRIAAVTKIGFQDLIGQIRTRLIGDFVADGWSHEAIEKRYLSRYFRKLFENSASVNYQQDPVFGTWPARAALRTLLASQEKAVPGTLYLVIFPESAPALDAIDFSSLWPTFETWKRMLVEEVERLRRQLPEGRRVELWDFTGHHCLALDPRSPKKAALWSDVDHHHHELANLIVARLQNRQLETPTLLATECPLQDFGARLDTETIERHLARLRDLRAHYRSSHPAASEQVRAIFERLNRAGYRHSLF